MVNGVDFDENTLHSEYYTSEIVSAPTVEKGQIELKYDNGTPYIMVAFENGDNMWVGNDFDTSTYSDTYPNIDKFRIYCSDSWPNDEFDGSYIAIQISHPEL